jgi:tetratricopeptide (TPR) repeat protein
VKSKLIYQYVTAFNLIINALALSAHGQSRLSCGDNAVLAAPVADFRKELKRMKLPAAEFHELALDLDPRQASIDAELEDLKAALQKGGTPSNTVQEILASQGVGRGKIKDFEERLEGFPGSEESEIDESGNVIPRKLPAPVFPKITVHPGLPAEFADYLEALTIWRNPKVLNKRHARVIWERLLNRPPAERHYKSVWAAFMLAKSWEKENPAKAVEYYRKARELTSQGFADSLGLAASSIGWEARVYLNEKNYERATDLYIQQMACGVESAPVSLCLTMRSLFADGGASSFSALAKNERTRQVVTAYIISTRALQEAYGNWTDSVEGTSNRVTQIVSDWAAVNQKLDVKDPAAAEGLALGAYQNSQWDAADFWIKRSESSPVSQWLKAKLLIRSGKIAQGTALLSSIVRFFPVQRSSSTENTPVHLYENLYVPGGDGSLAGNNIRGELGVIYFAQGLYSRALDCFIQADLWPDAAYIGERILSLDELKSYVDGNLPALQASITISADNGGEPSENQSAKKLRYLLARRLTRAIRGNEARDYYPAEWQPHFDELANALLTGWNEAETRANRAQALFEAGMITRTLGMELLGTELAPDWHLSGGNSEGSLTGEYRALQHSELFPATSDELERYARHKADPERRFHYRYQAAFLGWEAAKLMENGTDETARILCTAGSWLKNTDPETADLFYKSLVRRCGTTSLGSAADRARWFPVLNETGELARAGTNGQKDVQSEPDSESDELAEMLSTVYPVPGKTYIVRRGDSLASIAQAASGWGKRISLDEILENNPELNPARLTIGQKIELPESQPEQ